MEPGDSKSRFSSRVDAYARWRPSYPVGVVDALEADGCLGPSSVVADVGSGTGIFSALLLGSCGRLFGVEPNAPMRKAAEEGLKESRRFTSVDGSAEATGLDGSSVDLVTAAQAFHWFRVAEFGRECRRILRPGGKAALVWNERVTRGTPFLEAYEDLLLRRGTDYARVRHENVSQADFAAFFGTGGWRTLEFPNEQVFDLEGLEGRLLSSSYAPAPGHPQFGETMRELRDLFHAHARGGRVVFLYTTRLHLGSPG